MSRLSRVQKVFAPFDVSRLSMVQRFFGLFHVSRPLRRTLVAVDLVTAVVVTNT